LIDIVSHIEKTDHERISADGGREWYGRILSLDRS